MANPFDRLFSRFKRRARQPDTIRRAVTGDQKYVAQVSQIRKQNEEGVLAHRFDDISIEDLDRARHYPILKDAVGTLADPVCRADGMFKCQDPRLAELAQELLGPYVKRIKKSLIRGAFNFGYQVCGLEWEPMFDVRVSNNQSSAGADAVVWPFAWGIRRVRRFSPKDTKILIYPSSGEFAGVRQFVGRIDPKKGQDVPARQCVIYSHDSEFDSLYGAPLIKPAIPFVEMAEGTFDSMSVFYNKYSNPYKVGRYPMGTIPVGLEGGKPQQMDNGKLMGSFLEALEGGGWAALPSECHMNGEKKWDIELKMLPGASVDYVGGIELLNEMIRIAVSAPMFASSGTPDTGTYNLGENVIKLLQANLQGYLDEIEEVFNEQICPRFALYNGGIDAPKLRLVFQPIDFDTARAVLMLLLDKVKNGEPIEEVDGKAVVIDGAKIAEDNGIPTKTINSSLAARGLLDQVRQSLAAGVQKQKQQPTEDDEED